MLMTAIIHWLEKKLKKIFIKIVKHKNIFTFAAVYKQKLFYYGLRNNR